MTTTQFNVFTIPEKKKELHCIQLSALQTPLVLSLHDPKLKVKSYH